MESGSFGRSSKVHVARGPFLQRANALEASRAYVTCAFLLHVLAWIQWIAAVSSHADIAAIVRRA